MNWCEIGTQEEAAAMTWIVRNAFLALVAFATLAVMLMMAMTVEATDLTSGYSSSPSGTQVSVD